MWIQLYDDQLAKVGEPLRLVDLRLQAGARPIELEAGEVYWLALYEDHEGEQESRSWRPMETPEVSVMQLATTAEDAAQPVSAATADATGPLLLRVRFEPHNNRPLRKTVRWRFRSVDGAQDSDAATYSCFHLPLVVRPRPRRVRNAYLSLVLGLALAVGLEVFTPALAYGAPLSISRGFGTLFLMLAIVGVLCYLYFLIANRMRWTLPGD